MDNREKKRLIIELQGKLDQAAKQKTKLWFDNYLKGAIEYRGVKTPEVLKITQKWRKQEKIDCLPLDDQLSLCEGLISQNFAEDKFAGTIFIQHYLRDEMDSDLLLTSFDRLFRNAYFYDWSTTDWFCTRVLDPFILNSSKGVAIEISGWKDSPNFWQRRASIVSMRGASKDKKYHSLIKNIIARLVKDNSRFIQTGIGWTLADMSKHHPEEAEKIFKKYLKMLSKEVIDRHSKYLSGHKELKAKKREMLK